MPEQQPRQLFVVEAARRRVVVSARDAGRARTVATVMLLGNAHAADRDALMVREPEEEERAAFAAKCAEIRQDGGLRLTAVSL